MGQSAAVMQVSLSLILAQIEKGFCKAKVRVLVVGVFTEVLHEDMLTGRSKHARFRIDNVQSS